MNLLHLIVLVIVVAAVAALWISAVVSIVRIQTHPALATAIRLLVTLILPVLGPIVWCTAGRSRPDGQCWLSAATGRPGG